MEIGQLLLTVVLIQYGEDQTADFMKIRSLVLVIALLAAIAGYLLQLKPSLLPPGGH